MTRSLPLAALFLAVSACGGDTPPQPPNLCEAPDARCVSAPARDVVAVDGDTFELQRLTVRGTQRIRLRLIGWDSPETGNAAQCPAEDALGQQVEARAKALFAAGQTVTFKPEGTDQYGRTRVHVYLDGTPIGWRLAKEGLAAEWEAGSAQPGWCG